MLTDREVAPDGQDDASSTASDEDSSAPASRYPSISSGMSGLFMTYRDVSPPCPVAEPDPLALRPPSPVPLLPVADSAPLLDGATVESLVLDAEEGEHCRVEQWLDEQHSEQQQLGGVEDDITVPETPFVLESTYDEQRCSAECDGGAEKNECSNVLSTVSSHPYLAYPDLPHTPTSRLKNNGGPFQSVASLSSYIFVDEDEVRDDYSPLDHQTPTSGLSSYSATVGHNDRRLSHDIQSKSASPWRTLRLRRSNIFLSSLTSASSSPIKTFNEMIKTESRNANTKVHTPRKHGSSAGSAPIFHRSPIPHILLSSTPDQSESLDCLDLKSNRRVVIDDPVTPKASRIQPRMWSSSLSTRSTFKPMPLPITPTETVYPLLSPPRHSTSTEGTYVSSLNDSNTSATDSSPSPSLSSAANSRSSRFKFSLRNLARVSGLRNQDQVHEGVIHCGPPAIKLDSQDSFLPAPPSTVTTSSNQTENIFPSGINTPVPTALRSPIVLRNRVVMGGNDGNGDNESLCPSSFRHVRTGSQSTTSTSASMKSSNNNSVRRSLDMAFNEASDNTSGILRDLAIYSNSNDMQEQDGLDVLEHLDSMTVFSSPMQSKYATTTRKFVTGLVSSSSGTGKGPLMSAAKSMSSSKRKKLIVSGIRLNDEAALVGVRKWCESFGDVRCMMRARNGELHVDFRSADVANTVCRLRAQVYISGVGSVGLSWYAGKMPV